jgi:Ribbon-helix-helix protein, copG family
MRRSKTATGGREGAPAKGGRRSADRASRSSRGQQLWDAAVSLDAEDIALAHLQAHLRRTEAIQTSVRPAASDFRRTTVRLPVSLIAHLRERAKRDHTTASEVVKRALERYLRSH